MTSQNHGLRVGPAVNTNTVCITHMYTHEETLTFRLAAHRALLGFCGAG